MKAALTKANELVWDSVLLVSEGKGGEAYLMDLFIGRCQVI